MLLKRRGKWRRYLILPVPVVFLLIAFTLQLSKKKKNQHNQYNCLFNKLNHEKGLSDLVSTFADAGGGEAAGSASALLEVEAAAAAADAEGVGLVPPLAEATRSLPLFLLLLFFKIKR